MAKRPSLSYQMWQQLENKKAIGTSRHLSKLIAKEQGGKVESIHSYKTYDSYKQSSKAFCKWLKSEHPNIKFINEIERDICIEYIKYLEQSNYSAYTYSQSMSMISKTLNISLTKKECNVLNRSLKNITQNRKDNCFRTKSGAVETIIRGTGLRRNELVNLEVKDLIISSEAVTGIVISKGSKGGRPRVCEVLKEYQEPIYKLIENLDKNSKVINEVIDKKLQTHRLRAQYAQNMYEELIKLGRKNPSKDLTKSLGHNRTNILVHYGVNLKK